MSNMHADFFTQIVNEDSEKLHGQGFSYLHLGLMPRLLEAAKLKDINRDLIAEVWEKVGEVYAFNFAPKRSIDCYKKSLLLKANNENLLLKMIQLQIKVGAYNDAFTNVDKLLDIVPDKFEYISLRQKIQDDMVYDSEPEWIESNVLWNLYELLAVEKFETVINTVLESDMKDARQLKCMACAFGALAHHSNYLKTWEPILELDASVTINNADRFYMPKDLQANTLFASLPKE